MWLLSQMVQTQRWCVLTNVLLRSCMRLTQIVWESRILPKWKGHLNIGDGFHYHGLLVSQDVDAVNLLLVDGAVQVNEAQV